MMNDKDKVILYEVHIEDMLRVLQSRMAEFGNGKGLSEFEQGRHLAYWEMMDIIKTRHSIILELIADEEEDPL